MNPGKMLMLRGAAPSFSTAAYLPYFFFFPFSRVVTSSCLPYKVVFVNAAYAALTGVASNETLGYFLHDLVLDGNSGKLSLESCAALSSEGDDISVFVVCRKGSLRSSKKCRMKVTPIVLRSSKPAVPACDVIGGDREVGSITHFAVDFSTADVIEPSGKVDEEEALTCIG